VIRLAALLAILILTGCTLAHQGAFDLESYGKPRIASFTGDGTTDQTASLQAAIDAIPNRGTLELQGAFIISDELTLSANNITIRGPALIKAKADTQFEYMMRATGRTGIVLEGLEFDANKDARKSGQSVRYMTVALLGCTECRLVSVTARGALGYAGGSAVGITVAGGSVRCQINTCIITDCGEAGHSPAKDADGVFTSGEQNVITGCIATNCTDVGFVIESSNQSVISACTARYCGGGGAITSANNNDRMGNIIDGLTVLGWNGSVGAVQIGVPGEYNGNLLETIVSNVNISAERPTYGGPGPAIYVSGYSGYGEVRGLKMSTILIRGAATQGILVARGKRVHIEGADISGTTDSCVQFQNGTGHTVSFGYFDGGSFGVITQNASEAFVRLCTIRNSTSNGLWASGTSTMYQQVNTILNPYASAIAQDSGATIHN